MNAEGVLGLRTPRLGASASVTESVTHHCNTDAVIPKRRERSKRKIKKEE